MADRRPALNRRDFLATSTMSLAALGLGLPRATVAAAEPGRRAPAGARIVRAAIYPAMGFSRVGNSDRHFFAPEIPGVPPRPEGGFKDGTQKMKRQVQRFRIYGFDEEGRVVRELDSERGDEMEWTVHVANSKGAWYQFNSPMDMGSRTPGLTAQLRNQMIDGEEREQLIIDPGPASIRGGEAGSREMTGGFWIPPNRVSVQLGTLRSDHHGRLLVVPGAGVGGSAPPDNPIASFSDNDGWYDDWCDGPVRATVRVDGRELEAESAWVTCCGPDFAPEIHTFVTLYDVIRDVMVNGKRFAGKDPVLPGLPERISFLEEVYPLFHRLGLMEWLASSAQLRQGWSPVGDFLDDEYMRRLADPSPSNRAFRQEVFEQFRDPLSEEAEQYKLPSMLGSGANYDFSPAHWFLLPRLQYEILGKWARGEFTDDLDRDEAEVADVAEIPLEHQPDALTRAALEACSGGAFHPGVELTWPLRQEALFHDRVPFRIRLGNRPSLLQNVEVGRQLNPETTFDSDTVLDGNPSIQSGEAYTFVPGPNAPIGPQMAGDLTRWMGLPWFGDAFSCGLAVEYANDFPNAIWWPAVTPIDVLPEVYYRQLFDDELDDEEKMRFFENRVPWVRGVRGIGLHAEASYIDGLAGAVALWPALGVVVKRKRPENLSPALRAAIPEELFVEVDRGSMDLMTGEQPYDGVPRDPDAGSPGAAGVAEPTSSAPRTEP